MEFFILPLLKVTNLCHCRIIVSQLPKVVLTMPANFHCAASEHTPLVTSISSPVCGEVVTIEVRQSRNQVYNSGEEARRQQGRKKEQWKDPPRINQFMYSILEIVEYFEGKPANCIDFQEWKTSVGGLESVSLIWPIPTPAENINSLVAMKGHPLGKRGGLFLVLSHRVGERWAYVGQQQLWYNYNFIFNQHLPLTFYQCANCPMTKS